VLAPTPAFYRRQLRRIRDFVLAHSCTTLMLDEASRWDEKDLRSQTLAYRIVELNQADFKYGPTAGNCECESCAVAPTSAALTAYPGP
jgi:circadian clock protein KaiC